MGVPSCHTDNGDYDFPRPMLQLVTCCDFKADQNSFHAYLVCDVQT